jgi:hypothetical protein
MKNFLILTTILLCASLTRAKTYYVSSSAGNDGYSGLSKTDAWKTLKKVNTLNYKNGDSILLKGGDLFDGNLVFNSKSKGSINSPIVVSAYDTTSGLPIIANKYNTDAIYIKSTSGYYIGNLIIKCVGKTGNVSGVYIFTDDINSVSFDQGITIDNVEAYNFWKAGIYVYSNPSGFSRSGYSNIVIKNSKLHDNGSEGIAFAGNYLTIDTTYNHHNIKIFNNTTYKNGGSGIILGQCDSALVDKCVAYDNGAKVKNQVGIWTWDSKGIVIQRCESYNNHSGGGTDGDGFDIDGGVRNSVMQYNYSHDNEGAGYLVWQYDFARRQSNNIVRYNISENDSRGQKGYYGCVAIGHTDTTDKNAGVHDLYIYNNTFYKNKISGPLTAQGPAISCQGYKITNVNVFNNVFQFDSTNLFVYIYNKAGIKFLNNCYYSNIGFKVKDVKYACNSIKSWAYATKQETLNGDTFGYFKDPQLTNPGLWGTNTSGIDSLNLVNFYRLKKSSPCLNTGLNGDSLYPNTISQFDYYGDTLHPFHKFSIGAEEPQPIHFAPKSKFNYGGICLGDSTKFVDSSTKAIKYLWSFGDGDTSTKINPIHYYKNDGKYKVKLTTTSIFQRTDSLVKLLDIRNPSASFKKSIIGANIFSFLPKDTLLKTYHWVFNDSQSVNGVFAKHTFKYTGLKSVQLQVTDSFNCKSQMTDTFSFVYTSVNNIDNPSKIKVYPNPCVDYIKVEMGSSNFTIFYYTISSISGEEVQSGQISNKNPLINLKSSLTKGNYVLRLTDGQMIKSIQILKL